jgi:flagellar hook-associated protein 2
VLQLSGTKTGSSNSFDVQGIGTVGAPVSLINVTDASDARLEIGGGDANSANGGYNVTSSTNTFSNTLLPGVSIAVSKLEDGVSIEASSDVSGIADKFQALVDAANSALDEISKQTAYDASTKKGSPLTGDFAVRNMSQTILSAVSQGLSYDDPAWVRPDPDTVPPSTPDKINFGSLAQFGVQLDDTGHLTFDSAKFTESYNDDPSKIQKAGIALGDQFEAMAGSMSTNVQSVITGRNSEIDQINTQIDDWDVRLDAKRTALQKQYSDLEVALGKLKDQSNWLSGQLAGLH